MYNKETIFHLPGIFAFWQGYKELLELISINPNILKENVKIGSIYDSPQCIWNGGRIVTTTWDQERLLEVRDYMIYKNIPVRFTFTNCLLEEKHTYDTYGNLLLKIFNTGNNEIICNSEVLETYIRNNYGDNYKYISSTTKRLNNQEEQNAELDKNYYLVVLDYDHNQTFDYLETIQNKDKCEILCNPVCVPNCPKRAAHYRNNSRCQLNFTANDIMKCTAVDGRFWYAKKHNPRFISSEDINNIYLPMGFSNFKLEGRTTHVLDWIEIILYYLIKEEYVDEVRSKLQMAVW